MSVLSPAWGKFMIRVPLFEKGNAGPAAHVFDYALNFTVLQGDGRAEIEAGAKKTERNLARNSKHNFLQGHKQVPHRS